MHHTASRAVALKGVPTYRQALPHILNTDNRLTTHKRCHYHIPRAHLLQGTSEDNQTPQTCSEDNVCPTVRHPPHNNPLSSEDTHPPHRQTGMCQGRRQHFSYRDVLRPRQAPACSHRNGLPAGTASRIYSRIRRLQTRSV